MRARPIALLVLAFPSVAAAIPLPGAPLVGEDLVVGEGVSRDGVTVYPVLALDAPKLPEDQAIVTFADALRTGALSVTEVGHDMQVATLRVHNRGKDPVLVMAGEIVEGGAQDRVIAQDLVIPPSEAPVAVRVNCVERGRWGGGQAFAYGGRAEPGLRRVVQVQRNQDATWAAVSDLNAGKAALVRALGYDAAALAPRTGTYLASMRHGVLEAHVAKLTEALSAEVAKEGDVVGLVVAVGGEIVGGEVYGYPEVFASVREETIAAVARDAMSRGAWGRTAAAPSVASAQSFLAASLGGEVVESGAAGIARHARVESADALSWVLSEADGDVLHLVAYRR